MTDSLQERHARIARRLMIALLFRDWFTVWEARDELERLCLQIKQQSELSLKRSCHPPDED